jgi:hypothetical protein
VVTYGADPTGTRDSTVGIQKAITAAEDDPGSTVSFPAGRYVLDDPGAGQTAFVIDRATVHIVGAGAATTTIVQEAGAKSGLARGQGIFRISTPHKQETGGADGSSITGLTLDSASYDGGTPILDSANNTTISQDTVQGPRSDKTYNKGQFAVRVITVCQHDDLAEKHRSDNTVSNLVLSGAGKAGNTDLDLSCQENDTVSNITDTGNGMDVYIATNVSINGLVFHPGPGLNHPEPYIIVGPTNNVTIANVTSYGLGGKLQQNPKGGSPIVGTTITNEQMLGGSTYALTIGDADNTKIVGSKLGRLVIAPDNPQSGLVVSGSQVAGTTCSGSGTITAVTGVTCG